MESDSLLSLTKASRRSQRLILITPLPSNNLWFLKDNYFPTCVRVNHNSCWATWTILWFFFSLYETQFFLFSTTMFYLNLCLPRAVLKTPNTAVCSLQPWYWYCPAYLWEYYLPYHNSGTPVLKSSEKKFSAFLLTSKTKQNKNLWEKCKKENLL